MNFEQLLSTIVKMTPKIIYVIGLFCLLLILANSLYPDQFGLNTIIETNRIWISIFFLFSLAYFIVDAGTVIFKFSRRKIGDYLIHKKRVKRLYNLSSEEKEVFLGYLLQDTHTQYFNCSDGVILGLEKEGLVFPSSGITVFARIAFNIQPWVWNELKKNYERIFSEEEITSFKNSKTSVEDKSVIRGNPLAPRKK